MALTSCMDCGHDISTLAVACTHCGRPTAACAEGMTGRERAARIASAFMIGTAAFLLMPEFALVILALVVAYSIWQVTQYVAKGPQASEPDGNSVQGAHSDVHLG